MKCNIYYEEMKIKVSLECKPELCSNIKKANGMKRKSSAKSRLGSRC